jgi:hypothetical protein
MIELCEKWFLSKGQTRACYIHPEDPSKVIKVDFIDKGYEQTAKEALYYRKIARLKPDIEYDFIPRFHGSVETNLGKGGIFDLIRDEDTGEVSKTLADYYRDGGMQSGRASWDEAFSRFRERLYSTGVIIKDLNMRNLCVQRRLDGSRHLVAIDGIGHRDFIPLCDYLPWFARRKIRRSILEKGLDSFDSLMTRMEEKARAKKLRLARTAGVSS